LHPVLLYGLGRSHKDLLSALKDEYEVYFTSDSKKECQQVSGVKVLTPEEALNKKFHRVFVTPGIPVTHKVFTVFSPENEISWAKDKFPNAKFIGVTGSSGKSTTCKVIADYLTYLGYKVALGGNYGVSLSSFVGTGSYDYIVLELSSFQLFSLKHRFLDFAALTTFEPNHVDWHGSVEHYASTKGEIFSLLNPGGCRVCSEAFPYYSSEYLRLSQTDEDGDVYWSREKLKLHGNEIRLKEMQSFHAMSWGILEAVCRHFSLPSFSEQDFEFIPLSHRLEPVGILDGAVGINDSKSTTPGAVFHALKQLPYQNIELILGGKDKGIELAPFFRELLEYKPRLLKIYLYGYLWEHGEWLKTQGVNVCCKEGWGDILEEIKLSSSRGDCILLSPGCSSLDQFSSFEARGDAFREFIRQS
jgi:UDP-N-acetylmuramoylalanine--D-glutamate ligase